MSERLRCPRCGKRWGNPVHWSLCCECVIPFDDEARADTLDAAWAEAEAALPEGWFIGGLELLRLPTRNRPLWRAMAVQPMTIGGGRVSGEVDASPAAALLALAAKLRENH